jgi:hypothetical protein
VRRSSLLLALALIAGCGGDGDGAITREELPAVVLQPADLPRVWVKFDEGRLNPADAPAGGRSDPSRFDRVEGWKARYRRAGSPRTPGPLVIESRADLFSKNEGARQDFQLLEGELESALGAGGKRIEAPSLGEQSVAATLDQGGGPAGVRYYLIAWRRENVVAALVVNGFARSLTLEQTLEVARKQERRIDAAAKN